MKNYSFVIGGGGELKVSEGKLRGPENFWYHLKYLPVPCRALIMNGPLSVFEDKYL